MKITDLRTGRIYEGDHIDTIPGGSQATDEQLDKYLGIGPLSKQYPYVRRAAKHKRMVLRDGQGNHFVLAVDERFWRVER
jgi:hypothetical protein